MHRGFVCLWAENGSLCFCLTKARQKNASYHQPRPDQMGSFGVKEGVWLCICCTFVLHEASRLWQRPSQAEINRPELAIYFYMFLAQALVRRIKMN